jgi:hypothetical protein
VLPTLALWAFVQWALEFRPQLVHQRSPALVAAVTLGITVAVAAFCAVISIGLQSS